jgi:hypothetical protein
VALEVPQRGCGVGSVLIWLLGSVSPDPLLTEVS